MNCFITFEGIEGSGKSTQIALLAETLRQRGLLPILTREPGGCPIADQIRAILLNPRNTALDARAELLLYAAARAQHVSEVIRPALDKGELVLCDRYIDATLAYQGDGRRLDLDLIENLNRIAAGGTTPGLTFLIDLPAETGLQRALRREKEMQDSSEGRFEREALAFHQRVRQGYLRLAATETERFRIVDGQLGVKELAEIILRETLDFLKQQKASR